MFARLNNNIKEFLAYAKCQHFKASKPLVLLYHGIDLNSNNEFNFRFSSVYEFEKQITFIKNKFQVVPLEVFFNNNNKVNHCAITFDDRYENWINLARPIIKKLDVPVTFFVSSNQANLPYLWTDFIDIASQLCNILITFKNKVFKRNKWGRYVDKNNYTLKEYLKNKPFDYKLNAINQFVVSGFDINKINPIYWKILNGEQIKNLSKEHLITIGSHGNNHNNLGLIPELKAKKELLYSKEYLENITQKEVDSLAYPDGSYTRRVIDIAEEIGYKYQLACDYSFDDDIKDNRIINRKGIYTDLSYYNQLSRVII